MPSLRIRYMNAALAAGPMGGNFFASKPTMATLFHFLASEREEAGSGEPALGHQ
jgi:hypothetical protein